MTARSLFRGALGFASACAASIAFIACDREVLVGDNMSAVGPGADGAAGSGGSTGAGGSPTCVKSACQNHFYACGNCVDDDFDGLVDMDDPDCVGPCQNAEDTFFGSIPGQNHAKCAEDCYFDQDSGSGNDGCVWSHACDPLLPKGAACPANPNEELPGKITCQQALTTQSDQCLAVCGPLTPNGCDCFGCCTIPGVASAVFLGSIDEAGNPTCDLAHAADPARCHPCTQVQGCLNPCDTCERCIGKTTLPPECTDASCSVPACSGGARPCGDSCLPQCPSGQSCITGCCATPPQ